RPSGHMVSRWLEMTMMHLFFYYEICTLYPKKMWVKVSLKGRATVTPPHYSSEIRILKSTKIFLF
ncbi:MAG: hypothetical protein AAF702_33985, partial [Chloroflexota bacterium]